MSKAKNTKQKIVESSEEEQGSSSPVKVKVNKKQQLQNKKANKNQQDVQSESEESVPIVQKKPHKLVKTQNQAASKRVNPLKRAQKQQSSEQPSDSSEEKPQKKIVKTQSPLQTALKQKKPVKKQTSSEESSEQQQPKKITKPTVAKAAIVQKKTEKQSSESQEQSEEQEPKKATKVQPVTKAKSPMQKTIVPKKKIQQSESSEEQQDLNKTIKQKPAILKQAVEKKQSVPIVQKKEAVQPKVEQPIDEEGEFQVCVKGLSFYALQNDVEQLFKPAGNIVSVKLLMREDGKSKGMAFVKFSSKNSYNTALQLNGTQHLGRDIRVEPSLSKHNKNNQAQTTVQITSSTLFVAGLSFSTTQESISAFFGQAGEVVSVRIATDKEIGKPKGFGYVQFRDIDTAKKAYQTLNNQVLDSRQLRIDNATQRDRPQGGKKGYQKFELNQNDKNNKKGAIATFQGRLMAI